MFFNPLPSPFSLDFSFYFSLARRLLVYVMKLKFIKFRLIFQSYTLCFCSHPHTYICIYYHDFQFQTPHYNAYAWINKADIFRSGFSKMFLLILKKLSHFNGHFYLFYIYNSYVLSYEFFFLIIKYLSYYILYMYKHTYYILLNIFKNKHTHLHTFQYKLGIHIPKFAKISKSP